MKQHSHFLILLFLLSIPFLSIGQVYTSKIIKSEVLAGPENCNSINLKIAAQQEFKINNHLQLLKDSIEVISTEINVLEGDLKKKKTKKKYQNLIDTKDKILSEIEITVHFHKLWFNELETYRKTTELVALIKEGNCYQITTKNGTLNPNQYSIKKQESQLSYTLSIPLIKYIKAESKWVKKEIASKNNAVRESNNYVLCLEETDPQCIFMEYNEQLYNKADCPKGFEYDEASNTCLKTEILTSDNPQLLIEYQIIRTSDGEAMNLLEWVEVECE